MSKRTITVGALVVAFLLAMGGLYASNMGFKLNYTLAATGDATPFGASANGTNAIGLPYNRQAGLANASNLYTDIGSARVQNIQQYDVCLNAMNTYNGSTGDFGLNYAEGYFVRMLVGQGGSYIVVGSHDPSTPVNLYGTGEATGCGTSANGTNFLSYPYHATAADARALIDDIGSADVQNVQQYDEFANAMVTYAYDAVDPGFTLVPGEAYFVRIKAGITVSYTPSHY